MLQIKSVKLRLAESLLLDGLVAKLTEEEMNEKGPSKATEEKLIEVSITCVCIIHC